MQFGKKDAGILLVIILIFSVISLTGIDWGSPYIWHPDEILQRVAFTFDQTPAFDQSQLTYPSLPLFFMTFIAKMIDMAGKGQYSIIVGIRVFSALMGATILVINYLLTTKITSNRWVGIISSVFILTNNEYLINSRFAHNDIYMMFFGVLSVYSLINYKNTKKMRWLYTSFLLVGLAAGSKYNGGALLLAPILIYALEIFSSKNKKYLKILGEYFTGGLIAFFGYLIGNPIFLKDPIHYVKTLIGVLDRHANYNIKPGDLTGFWGQWSILNNITIGNLFFPIIILAIVYLSTRLILQNKENWNWEEKKYNSVLVILIAIFSYDIPIMFSYNYPSRFFLLLVPLFAILFGIFINDILILFKSKKWISPIIIGIIIFGFIKSGLETASVILTFSNDSRRPASNYLYTFPNSYDLKIEYTLYPPNIDKIRFLAAHNYPIIFIKHPGDIVYIQNVEFNTGEIGIEKRRPDILVIDSLTYDRFENDYICELHQKDCDFFNDLIAGNTNYQLHKSFVYKLPEYLPEVQVSFTNPEIHIFRRKP